MTKRRGNTHVKVGDSSYIVSGKRRETTFPVSYSQKNGENNNSDTKKTSHTHRKNSSVVDKEQYSVNNSSIDTNTIIQNSSSRNTHRLSSPSTHRQENSGTPSHRASTEKRRADTTGKRKTNGNGKRRREENVTGVSKNVKTPSLNSNTPSTLSSSSSSSSLHKSLLSSISSGTRRQFVSPLNAPRYTPVSSQQENNDKSNRETASTFKGAQDSSSHQSVSSGISSTPTDVEKLRKYIEEEKKRSGNSRGKRRANVEVVEGELKDSFKKIVEEIEVSSSKTSKESSPKPSNDLKKSSSNKKVDEESGRDSSSASIYSLQEERKKASDKTIHDEDEKSSEGRFWVVRNVVSEIGKIGLIFIVTVMLSLFFSSNLLGINVNPVVSGSMVPNLNKGDLIVTSNNFNGLAKGDIVTYHASWLDNNVVVHRIIEIDNGRIVTKGDHNHSADPIFSQDRVVGEVFAKIPFIGHFAQSWIIVTFSIISALMYCATDGIGDFIASKIFKRKKNN